MVLALFVVSDQGENLPDYLKLAIPLCWFSTIPEPKVMGRRASLVSHEIAPKDNDPFDFITSGSISWRRRSLLLRKAIARNSKDSFQFFHMILITEKPMRRRGKVRIN
jgi:hypothetical protein